MEKANKSKVDIRRQKAKTKGNVVIPGGVKDVLMGSSKDWMNKKK